MLVFIVINTNYSIPKAGEKVSKMATFLNTSITGGILIISVINGFASAFGGAILN